MCKETSPRPTQSRAVSFGDQYRASFLPSHATSSGTGMQTPLNPCKDFCKTARFARPGSGAKIVGLTIHLAAFLRGSCINVGGVVRRALPHREQGCLKKQKFLDKKAAADANNANTPVSGKWAIATRVYSWAIDLST